MTCGAVNGTKFSVLVRLYVFEDQPTKKDLVGKKQKDKGRNWTLEHYNHKISHSIERMEGAFCGKFKTVGFRDQRE